MLKNQFMPRLLLAQGRRRIRFFSRVTFFIFVRRILKNLKSQKKKKEKNKTHRRHEFIIQQRESFDYEALH